MKRSVLARASRSLAVALAAAVSLTALCGAATADPAKAPSVTSVVKDGRTWHLKVYSAAMDKEITVDVQRPVDESKPAPNLYLLSGLDAGLGTANWKAETSVVDFLAAKQVNVIQPIGGRATYYADWEKPDPKIGVAKWETFFTQELPPLLDETLNSTGLNALSGVSTSGTSVLRLAEAKPGLWKSVAAYSGCAQIADPLGRLALKLSVEVWGGGNVDNMYGPADSPSWAEHDPVINAEKLRGTQIYLSSSTGVPVKDDYDYYQTVNPGVQGNVDLTVGMVIEAATNTCTHNLKNKLDSINIPATYGFFPYGTHRWKYWDETFRDSWPILANGMEIPA
ncbi:esterase family protein [Nocardia sp. 2]|uniref:Esterase family protein n=1 Tax=Nocardia acididurans TaxID=2802282 RepID=A0ABS1ME68_9NOCA|nr:alpha/beta hydrolase family protein [Nocardia acididurans]MBL1078360.1 esterase family protein [Nocardia acididurans]